MPNLEKVAPFLKMLLSGKRGDGGSQEQQNGALHRVESQGNILEEISDFIDKVNAPTRR